MIELYVEFEEQSGLGVVGEEVNVDELKDIDWEEDNNDSEEEFEANYEVDDENDDGDLVGNPAVHNEADAIVSQHPFGVPSFVRTLDLEVIHAPDFPEELITLCYSRTEQEYNKNYQRLKERGNIVVYRFDRRNEMFEVREMQDGSVYTINLVQRHCDCGHFQVERLPCRHVLSCCTNQHLDWQVYVHDVYKMSEIYKVYRGEFVSMGDPSTWDRYEKVKVIAN
ncbi:hypothetical protein Ahy_A03g014294 [Arachis hypogaea]|uniref:SWIM-type domain-containing protein n=1 Tax=Arachis hypogaea TaxID=3818 RepID=A0A445DXE3_ARAHY|nr:hypothetical protein Ahy_A03g014294 [Arachis hypogaea]